MAGIKKYCAFGELGFNHIGLLLESHKEYIVIETNGKWKEYWDPRYVKIFDSEKEAIEESEKWKNY